MSGFSSPYNNLFIKDWGSILLGITNISTSNPGAFEWIDKCIWFAFFELSGAITYAKKAINATSIIYTKLIIPDKFFLILKKGFFKI